MLDVDDLERRAAAVLPDFVYDYFRATAGDLRVLRDLVPIGVEGAIVGKALYAGAFTLTEALEVSGTS